MSSAAWWIRGSEGRAGEMRLNRRTGTLGFIIVSVAILSIMVIAGIVCAEEATAVDFAVKNQLPSAGHLFGTDFMGRDMFVRCV